MPNPPWNGLAIPDDMPAHEGEAIINAHRDFPGARPDPEDDCEYPEFESTLQTLDGIADMHVWHAIEAQRKAEEEAARIAAAEEAARIKAEEEAAAAAAAAEEEARVAAEKDKKSRLSVLSQSGSSIMSKLSEKLGNKKEKNRNSMTSMVSSIGMTRMEEGYPKLSSPSIRAESIGAGTVASSIGIGRMEEGYLTPRDPMLRSRNPRLQQFSSTAGRLRQTVGMEESTGSFLRSPPSIHAGSSTAGSFVTASSTIRGSYYADKSEYHEKTSPTRPFFGPDLPPHMLTEETRYEPPSPEKNEFEDIDLSSSSLDFAAPEHIESSDPTNTLISSEVRIHPSTATTSQPTDSNSITRNIDHPAPNINTHRPRPHTLHINHNELSSGSPSAKFISFLSAAIPADSLPGCRWRHLSTTEYQEQVKLRDDFLALGNRNKKIRQDYEAHMFCYGMTGVCLHRIEGAVEVKRGEWELVGCRREGEGNECPRDEGDDWDDQLDDEDGLHEGDRRDEDGDERREDRRDGDGYGRQKDRYEDNRDNDRGDRRHDDGHYSRCQDRYDGYSDPRNHQRDSGYDQDENSGNEKDGSEYTDTDSSFRYEDNLTSDNDGDTKTIDRYSYEYCPEANNMTYMTRTRFNDLLAKVERNDITEEEFNVEIMEASRKNEETRVQRYLALEKYPKDDKSEESVARKMFDAAAKARMNRTSPPRDGNITSDIPEETNRTVPKEGNEAQNKLYAKHRSIYIHGIKKFNLDDPDLPKDWMNQTILMMSMALYESDSENSTIADHTPRQAQKKSSPLAQYQASPMEYKPSQLKSEDSQIEFQDFPIVDDEGEGRDHVMNMVRRKKREVYSRGYSSIYSQSHDSDYTYVREPLNDESVADLGYEESIMNRDYPESGVDKTPVHPIPRAKKGSCEQKAAVPDVNSPPDKNILNEPLRLSDSKTDFRVIGRLQMAPGEKPYHKSTPLSRAMGIPEKTPSPPDRKMSPNPMQIAQARNRQSVARATARLQEQIDTRLEKELAASQQSVSNKASPPNSDNSKGSSTKIPQFVKRVATGLGLKHSKSSFGTSSNKSNSSTGSSNSSGSQKTRLPASKFPMSAISTNSITKSGLYHRRLAIHPSSIPYPAPTHLDLSAPNPNSIDPTSILSPVQQFEQRIAEIAPVYTPNSILAQTPRLPAVPPPSRFMRNARIERELNMQREEAKHRDEEAKLAALPLKERMKYQREKEAREQEELKLRVKAMKKAGAVVGMEQKQEQERIQQYLGVGKFEKKGHVTKAQAQAKVEEEEKTDGVKVKVKENENKLDKKKSSMALTQLWNTKKKTYPVIPASAASKRRSVAFTKYSPPRASPPKESKMGKMKILLGGVKKVRSGERKKGGPKDELPGEIADDEQRKQIRMANQLVLMRGHQTE